MAAQCIQGPGMMALVALLLLHPYKCRLTTEETLEFSSRLIIWQAQDFLSSAQTYGASHVRSTTNTKFCITCFCSIWTFYIYNSESGGSFHILCIKS